MAFAKRFIPTDVRGIDWGEAADFESVPGAFSPLVKARDVKGELTQNEIKREIQKTKLAAGPEPSLLGAKGGTMGFSLPVRGGKLAAGTGAESNLSKILSNCGMARQNVPDGIGVITGGTASTVTMLDAAGIDLDVFHPGGFICVNADKSGTPDIQLRAIDQLQSAGGTTTITVAQDFDTTPVNLDDYYALDSFIPAVGEPTLYTGLDLYKGQGATNRQKIRALGCALNWKIPTVAIGDLPMMEFEAMVDTWAVSEASRSDEDPADLLADPRAMLDAAFYWGAEELSTQDFAFDPAFPLTIMPGALYDNGKDGWWYGGPVPALEINPYHDAEFWALWAARTAAAVALYTVGDRYDFWGLCMFATQIVGVEESQVGESLIGSKPTFLATDPHESPTPEFDQLPLFGICFSGT